jgi:hypothetical protein
VTLKTNRYRCPLKIRSNFQKNIACYWTMSIRSFVVPSSKTVFDMVRGGRHKTDPSASWRRNTGCICTPDTLLFIVWHILFQKDKANHSLSWDETWPVLGWEDVFWGTVRNFTCWTEKKCSNIEENIMNSLFFWQGPAVADHVTKIYEWSCTSAAQWSSSSYLYSHTGTSYEARF